ncbi:site-specific integrase [Brevibacillus sp. NPDC003359]|uniref:site-specific integrase n=1 Tax=unclassified Brevibacillus TaxID=2684853 RepID=UPI0036BCB80A
MSLCPLFAGRLRWKDVNLDTGVLSITQTLSHDGKEMQVGAKTDSGNRTVAIDAETIKELPKLAKRSKAERIGTLLTPRNLMRTFYRLIEKADVKKIRFHDLRHTHVTMLLKANVNPKIVAERMG